jgi:iron complex transport system substrate-binding protein
VPFERLDPDAVIGRAGLGGVAAVRHGRVFAVDERLLGRPGPHMLEAARRMADAIRESASW